MRIKPSQVMTAAEGRAYILGVAAEAMRRNGRAAKRAKKRPVVDLRERQRDRLARLFHEGKSRSK